MGKCACVSITCRYVHAYPQTHNEDPIAKTLNPIAKSQILLNLLS